MPSQRHDREHAHDRMRRANNRLAITLGLVAFAFYAAFVLSGIL